MGTADLVIMVPPRGARPPLRLRGVSVLFLEEAKEIWHFEVACDALAALKMSNTFALLLDNCQGRHPAIHMDPIAHR
jgi:hypothetical protein